MTPVLEVRQQISRRALLRYGAGTLAGGALLSACGDSGDDTSDKGSTASGGNAKKTAFNFNLGFIPQGRNAPFYYGVEQGIYAKHGLDVTIESSAGTGAVLTLLSTGKTNAAIVGTSAMLKLMGSNPDPAMKSFATLYARNLSTIFYLEGGPIKTPKDLEGKTIASSAGSNEYLLFPIFAQANGIDPKKVKWKFVDPAVKTGLLLTKTVDATSTTFFGSAQLEAKAKDGEKIGAFVYGDHGVDGDPTTIAGLASYGEKNRAAMQAFIEGSMEAMAATLKNPDAAVDAMAKKVATLDKDIAKREVALLPQVVAGPAQKEKGLGYNDPEAIKATFDLVETTFKQKIAQPYTDFFSNDFVGKVKA